MSTSLLTDSVGETHMLPQDHGLPWRERHYYYGSFESREVKYEGRRPRLSAKRWLPLSPWMCDWRLELCLPLGSHPLICSSPSYAGSLVGFVLRRSVDDA